MAINKLFSNPPQSKALAASTVYVNDKSPFLVGEPVYVDSLAGTTLYGANHPGNLDETKYASFEQSIEGNKAFVLPSGVDAAQNTTGGALSAADQLRVIAMVDKSPKFRARGDQVVPSGQFIVAAGGGTAAGESGLVLDGAHAAGVETLNIKDDGANTETILVGDKIEIAGDDTDYFCTETSQALNGTTAVAVSITPPLQAAASDAAVVTVTAADGKTILFETAPAVGALVEVLVLESGDIVTVGNTGGALTAGQVYEAVCPSFLHTAGSVNMTKAMSH